MIGGFIITGTTPKKIIIRAIGPSLALPDKLANPTLELRSSSGVLLDQNDDWKLSSDKQAIIDSGIPPTDDLESAIVATLPANGAVYTAIVRGANNSTGIGLVEVYDLDRSVDSKLANISTRGLVQTGDPTLTRGPFSSAPPRRRYSSRARPGGNTAGPARRRAGAAGKPSQNSFGLEINWAPAAGTPKTHHPNWPANELG